MSQADNQITYFARPNFRKKEKPFGIKRTDRRAHMYVIGKTGTGKSTLLETLIRQDVEHGEGWHSILGAATQSATYRLGFECPD